jgi:release factor glutamine methyltransferase
MTDTDQKTGHPNHEPILWRGLAFETDDSEVYAPKPASFLLAEVASKRLAAGARALDMCTGSGVVGIAVAKFVKDAQVTVADANRKALAAAQRNAARNGVTISAVFSDLYQGFADGEFDVITVHPPAVPYPDGRDWGLSDGMKLATNGGGDGSELVVRSIVEARRHLKRGGRLLLLLPHWSNVHKARAALREHYVGVEEIARLDVDFFPVKEGKPDEQLLQHVRRLAAAGLIEMTFESEIPRSVVSVVEGWVK